MAFDNEVEQLFNRWLERTVDLHLEEIAKLNVGETQDLRASFRKELKHLGEGYLEGSLHFLPYGRFVDMGSGRGYSHGRPTGVMDRERKTLGRRKKPIYAKIFYARLNDLQGALGFKVMETAVERMRIGMMSS